MVQFVRRLGNTFRSHVTMRLGCNIFIDNPLCQNEHLGVPGKVLPWFEPCRKSASNREGSDHVRLVSEEKGRAAQGRSIQRRFRQEMPRGGDILLPER